MRRWLITGGSGFLGCNARLFLENQAEVFFLARNSKFQREQGSIPLDLLDEGALRTTVRDIRPDVILHAAALSSHEACQQDPALAFEVNSHSTRVLAQEAQEVGARLVYVSSDAVFDGTAGNYTEVDSPNPFSVYGESKLSGEIAALEENQDSLVLRTNFFGWSPSGRRSILEFFVNAFSEGKPVDGYQDFVVTSTYVSQLLEKMLILVDSRQTGVWHVASCDKLSKFEFGKLVVKAGGFLEIAQLNESRAPFGEGIARGGRDLSLRVKRLEEFGLECESQASGVQAAFADMHLRRRILDLYA